MTTTVAKPVSFEISFEPKCHKKPFCRQTYLLEQIIPGFALELCAKIQQHADDQEVIDFEENGDERLEEKNDTEMRLINKYSEYYNHNTYQCEWSGNLTGCNICRKIEKNANIESRRMMNKKYGSR